MITKLKYMVVTAALAAVVGGPAANAAEKINMKIANVLPAKAPRSRGAILVAKLVNADKRCPNIRAKDYPPGQPGGPTGCSRAGPS